MLQADKPENSLALAMFVERLDSLPALRVYFAPQLNDMQLH